MDRNSNFIIATRNEEGMGKFIDLEAEYFVNQLSQDETGKRQYYRPVYSLHKWWARRPGALFRSIILLATRGNRDEKSFALFERTRDGSLSAESEYFKEHRLEDVVILDPFMGGGTTLVEANRMGAKVIGCDLNPVSYWIVRETLKPIDLEKLDRYFRQIEETAGEKIKALYRTRCVECRQEADGMYYFWVRYVTCPHCKRDVYLYKRALLNEGLSRNKPISAKNPATVFCPQCFALNEWDGTHPCTCKTCGFSFDPEAGTYDQGFYECPHCHSRIRLLDTLSEGQTLKEKLVAIEYWCPSCQARRYKSPDGEDEARLDFIQETMRELSYPCPANGVGSGRLIFPRQKILEGDSSLRWRLHKYTHYYQLFNPRQILAFNYLFESILAIPEEEFRNSFITVFSNSLEYNNMMTPYNYPHRKLHHLFNYHALPLTTTPVENAVWGVGNEGAGTFVNCYKRYRAAKLYCQSPFDRFKDRRGIVRTVPSREYIAADFVASFDQLQKTPRSAMLFCGDSSSLPAIPDQSVDFIITDPPYFDNVHYSELSNFFYVWLAELIVHPYFEAEHVPTDDEAIVNGKMEKGEQEYQQLLRNVFAEGHRVLKENGRLIFTFHHSNWRAWWTILQAIVGSGFRVMDSFPVMSEYKVNPHIRNKQSLDMDLVLVCEKNTLPVAPLSLDPEDIFQRVQENFKEDLNATENKWFLRFMGELLRAASTSPEKVTYEWFYNSLVYFSHRWKQMPPEEHLLPSRFPEPAQMRLFEK
jgi:putative DNA methylase